MSASGSSAPVRIGVIGAGNISRLNVPGYVADERCQVLAISDPRREPAEAAAREWGIERIYEDTSDLLADPDIDAVEILSPTQLHVDHVVAAARAGKHVSCQKPIATSVADARRMVDACAEAGVIFRITENCCHYPPLERARHLIRDGAIGTPNVLRIKTVVGETDSKFQAELDPEGYTWRFDANSPGGHLFDDVIHKYAMALWLVDEDIRSVQAVVRKGRLFFEAPTVALFEYARPDLLGTMEVSHAPNMFIPSEFYGADEFFEVQGTDGFVWVTRLSGHLVDMPPVVVRTGNKTTEIRDVDADYAISFRRSAAAFVDAVVEGHQPDLAPEAAIKTLQLAFAVYQASNERRPVDPASIDGSVSPSWWPKTPRELLGDAAALGLLPDGMTEADAEALLELM